LGDADKVNNRGWLSLGYNASVSIWYWTSNNELVRWKQSKIRTPSKAELFADTLSGSVEDTPPIYGYCSDNVAVNDPNTGCSLSDRHGGSKSANPPQGSINVGLMDAHVKSYRWTQIMASASAPSGCSVEDRRNYNAAGLTWYLTGVCQAPE
jgi:hypothetical protein